MSQAMFAKIKNFIDSFLNFVNKNTSTLFIIISIAPSSMFATYYIASEYYMLNKWINTMNKTSFCYQIKNILGDEGMTESDKCY